MEVLPSWKIEPGAYCKAYRLKKRQEYIREHLVIPCKHCGNNIPHKDILVTAVVRKDFICKACVTNMRKKAFVETNKAKKELAEHRKEAYKDARHVQRLIKDSGSYRISLYTLLENPDLVASRIAETNLRKLINQRINR